MTPGKGEILFPVFSLFSECEKSETAIPWSPKGVTMKKTGLKLAAMALILFLTAGMMPLTGEAKTGKKEEKTTVEALHVGKAKGYGAPTILDEDNKTVLLKGASTHGLQWYPEYVSKDSFQTLRDSFGLNCVRLAAYVKEGGYLEGKQADMDRTIRRGVDAAADLGMYVIIDWHVLNFNPNETKDEAKTFFAKYAKAYKDTPNVIFEICNEPTGTPWYDGSGNDIYSYAKTMLKVIRGAGSNALVLVGTNTWSQDVDEVAKKPLDDPNVLYTLHFYAGTHYEDLKNKLRTALSNGTPVFVSEYGICDASGNGGIDEDNARDWLSLLLKNNISFCQWSLSNKAESASMIVSTCSKTYGWSDADLTQSGKFLKSIGTGSAAKKAAGKESSRKSKTAEAGLAAAAKTVNSWQGGRQLEVTLTNGTGHTVTGWEVTFSLDGKITDLWNGTKTVSGKKVCVKNADYNGTIEPGESVTFGLITDGKTPGKMSAKEKK